MSSYPVDATDVQLLDKLMVINDMTADWETLRQDVIASTVRNMTPERRRAWLLRPLGVGILAATTHGAVRGCGAGYGSSASGPREVVLGRSGHPVGWRRGRGERT